MDTSTFRPVPDNQEVWLSPEFKDGCFVAELLQFQGEPTQDNPLPYFFRDLAIHNSVEEGKYWLVEDSCQVYHNLPFEPEQQFVLGDVIARQDDNTHPSASSSQITVSTGIGLQCVSSRSSYVQHLPPPFDQLQPKQEASWVQIEICLLRLSNVQTDILITLSKPLLAASAVKNGADITHGKEFEKICKSFKIVAWSLFV